MSILMASNYPIEEIRYLENPPTETEFADLCAAMNITPFELIRKGEELYKTLNLAEISPKNNQAWLKIMTQNPKLIERPIIKIGDKVVIGRPPKSVQHLIDTFTQI